MAFGTGQRVAGKALSVDGFARDRKPRGQEPLLMLGTEPRIAQQVGVLGDPEDAFRRELLPAVGAGDSSQNPPHGRRAGTPARLAL